MSRQAVLAALEETRLIAIMRGDFRNREVPLVETLLAGGVTVVEVSTVSPNYQSSIQRIANAFAGRVHIGAGTILTVRHVAETADAGATFLVSPNMKPDVIAASRKHHMASFPGAYTPTEVLQAIEEGADAVKLFPANALGPGYVKALRGPLPSVRLIPTGGISLENINEYLNTGAWAVAVGSELVRAAEVQTGDWGQLQKRAQSFAQAARRSHG
ncbi:MAG: bifunctional 4-hydroxy-2-oxoglutarate aldolase/2-dehydro-3-deoxy-phosphogluconate aldolase [Sulfobacillus sp.]